MTAALYGSTAVTVIILFTKLYDYHCPLGSPLLPIGYDMPSCCSILGHLLPVDRFLLLDFAGGRLLRGEGWMRRCESFRYVHDFHGARNVWLRRAGQCGFELFR